MQGHAARREGELSVSQGDLVTCSEARSREAYPLFNSDWVYCFLSPQAGPLSPQKTQKTERLENRAQGQGQASCDTEGEGAMRVGLSVGGTEWGPGAGSHCGGEAERSGGMIPRACVTPLWGGRHGRGQTAGARAGKAQPDCATPLSPRASAVASGGAGAAGATGWSSPGALPLVVLRDEVREREGGAEEGGGGGSTSGFSAPWPASTARKICGVASAAAAADDAGVMLGRRAVLGANVRREASRGACAKSGRQSAADSSRKQCPAEENTPARGGPQAGASSKGSDAEQAETRALAQTGDGKVLTQGWPASTACKISDGEALEDSARRRREDQADARAGLVPPAGGVGDAWAGLLSEDVEREAGGILDSTAEILALDFEELDQSGGGARIARIWRSGARPMSKPHWVCSHLRHR